MVNKTKTVQVVTVSFLIIVVLLGTVTPVYKVYGVKYRDVGKHTDNNNKDKDWKEKQEREEKAHREDDREDQRKDKERHEKEKEDQKRDLSELSKKISDNAAAHNRDRDDNHDRDRHDRDDHDDDHDHDDHDDDHTTKVVIKERDNDDDEDDLIAYNHGYRDGQFDRISKLPFNDNMVPFKGDSSVTMYKIGYRSGWDSVTNNTTIQQTVPENPLLIK